MFGLNISVNYQENVADKDFEDVDDVDNEKNVMNTKIYGRVDLK